MCCFGDFKDGELCLPTLSAEIDGCMKQGVKIAYRPGDVIVFRAILLGHFVSKFSRKRTVFVLFTKNSRSWKDGS